MNAGAYTHVRLALSRDEFLDAVGALSRADLAWLDRTAAFLAVGVSGWCGDDLLRVATARTLSGRRNCPVHIGVVTHLGRTMQSIAHSERAKARRAETAWTEMEWSRESEDDPERRLERDETERLLRGKVADAFAHHPNARRVALAMLDGYGRAELRAFVGLDKTAYDTARRAVHRGLARHLSGGRR